MRILTKYSINEMLDCVIKNGDEEQKIRGRIVKMFLCVIDRKCNCSYYLKDEQSNKIYTFQLEERK